MSKIEWTEATWNPITGCSVISPGCTNCYAMHEAYRLEHHLKVPQYAGTTEKVNGKPVWTGKVNLAETALHKPLQRKTPTMYFVNSMSDLFHEDVPDDWIDRIFAVMALCPQHTFQVLTKRSSRMREYMAHTFASDNDWLSAAVCPVFMDWSEMPELDTWPPKNIWLGVSAENQEQANIRIPDLLATPAATRFVSVEPLLGPVDLEPWLDWPYGGMELPNGQPFGCYDCDTEGPSCNCPRDRAHFETTEGPRENSGCPEWVHAERITLDWVICGGESARGKQRARAMHSSWVRALRNQCQAARVPFFFKQWGDWIPYFQIGDRWKATTPGFGQVYRDGDCLFNGKALRTTHPGSDGEGAVRVGKKQAGNHLDGRQHLEMPNHPGLHLNQPTAAREAKT